VTTDGRGDESGPPPWQELRDTSGLSRLWCTYPANTCTAAENEWLDVHTGDGSGVCVFLVSLTIDVVQYLK
jgi:hypothetical protein